MLCNAFLWKLDTHPPPRHAYKVEPYTFVIINAFSRKSDTHPLRYVTLEWPHVVCSIYIIILCHAHGVASFIKCIHVQSSTMETNAIVNDIVDKIVTCGRVFRVPVLNYLVLGPQVGVLLSKILGKKAGHFSHLIQES